jgi:hypothetical protein
LFLFNADTWEKNEGFYCIWACYGQKPPSVSPNSPPSHRNTSAKSGLQQENEKLKKWALKMASILPAHGTYEKMRDFFVLHPVMEKNLSRFFKIRFIFPELVLRIL